jgi:sRNA-binding regulator protein Hfq
MTGDRLIGQLKRFDRFALVVEADEKEILVYKHGVVSVAADSSEE